ncbi:type VI secretion system ATPase TssH [Roseibium sediminis]|uniref:type VI secretion system ATPase TssH n=1 Tax=Roseibium sediminis TaxID=1775174 RepID=UPI00123E160D|nr:type VI secretion system ATPase TssH [Roseibium sediminis]
MARLDIRSLIDRLNTCSRRAIEEAGSVCVAKSHREVTVEHLLSVLLKQPGADVRIILKDNGVDPDHLHEDVERTFARFRQTQSDRTPTFSPLLLDLLQDAWIITSVQLQEPAIRSGAILLAILGDLGRYCDFAYYDRLSPLSPDDLTRRFAGLTNGSVEEQNAGVPAQGAASSGGADPSGDSALARFGTNFTDLAREGQIDPIFCRDREIRQIIEILCRRRKNNPICVGEAGVGKTALAEGFALKVAEGDVPEALKGVAVWGLDVGSLQAGASMKGEFEKRLKAVIEEVKSSPDPIILFIDEAHTLIGAGGDKGGSDAANLLKPALARGELKTIAATTWSEYKTYFEKDPALTRRFQLVKLDEPTVEDAVIILRGLKASYEKAHGVYISEKALEAAARLSARYITGRQLPDKAIDVIDTACARVTACFDSLPAEMERLMQEQKALERERLGLLRDQALGTLPQDQQDRLNYLDNREGELVAEISELDSRLDHQRELAGELVVQRRSLLNGGEQAEGVESLSRAELDRITREFGAIREQDRLVPIEVGAAEVAAVIGDWTGIPVSSMVEDDYQRLLTLSETMKQTIRGQDHALAAVEERLRASRLDLHRKGQPLGVFLLAGPSGVGKTETALEVARQLFGGEQFLTTINMSEYQERHTISRLIGSPPGYVGYGEGGILTEAIRKKPYSVVLLDEVEKADPNVLNLFYQAFDKGELADGEGRLIDCKNVVFFLTSNLGSDQIENWVATAEEGKIPSPAVMGRSLQPLFAQHFKPALLARMEPIVYLPLSDEVMAEIVGLKLDALCQLLKDSQKITLTISEAAAGRVQAMCGVSANGARFVDQVIQRQLLPTLSLEILEAGQRGETLSDILVDYEEDKGFAFQTSLRQEENEEPSLEAVQEA